MSCRVSTIEDGWDTLVTDAQADTFFPTRDWRANDGAIKAEGWIEIRALMGSMQLKRAVQATNDTRTPATTVAIPVSGGGNANANGVADPDATLTTLGTEGYRFVRDGYVGKVTSGTGAARVRGATRFFNS